MSDSSLEMKGAMNPAATLGTTSTATQHGADGKGTLDDTPSGSPGNTPNAAVPATVVHRKHIPKKTGSYYMPVLKAWMIPALLQELPYQLLDGTGTEDGELQRMVATSLALSVEYAMQKGTVHPQETLKGTMERELAQILDHFPYSVVGTHVNTVLARKQQEHAGMRVGEMSVSPNPARTLHFHDPDSTTTVLPSGDRGASSASFSSSSMSSGMYPLSQNPLQWSHTRDPRERELDALERHADSKSANSKMNAARGLRLFRHDVHIASWIRQFIERVEFGPVKTEYSRAPQSTLKEVFWYLIESSAKADPVVKSVLDSEHPKALMSRDVQGEIPTFIEWTKAFFDRIRTAAPIEPEQLTQMRQGNHQSIQQWVQTYEAAASRVVTPGYNDVMHARNFVRGLFSQELRRALGKAETRLSAERDSAPGVPPKVWGSIKEVVDHLINVQKDGFLDRVGDPYDDASPSTLTSGAGQESSEGQSKRKKKGNDNEGSKKGQSNPASHDAPPDWVTKLLTTPAVVAALQAGGGRGAPITPGGRRSAPSRGGERAPAAVPTGSLLNNKDYWVFEGAKPRYIPAGANDTRTQEQRQIVCYVKKNNPYKERWWCFKSSGQLVQKGDHPNIKDMQFHRCCGFYYPPNDPKMHFSREPSQRKQCPHQDDNVACEIAKRKPTF